MKRQEIIIEAISLGIPIVCDGKMFKQTQGGFFGKALCINREFLGYVPYSKALAIYSMADKLTDQEITFYKEVLEIVKMCIRDGINPFMYRHQYEADYLNALEESVQIA